MSLSLQLATSQLQHCYNILQTSHTHKPSPLVEAKENIADTSDVLLKGLCLSQCSEDVGNGLDGLSTPLPAVRVLLQWLIHQNVLWEQWIEVVDKSIM